jgi:GNAT superfamily N-acetyltransferase
MKAPVTFTLRPANPKDAPLFYRVIDQTMREFIIITWGTWNEARVQRESNEKSLDPKAQIIQVADISVGVFVVERCPTHIQLEHIYLFPEYQRRGIGTALLNNLIAEASQLKIPVRLRVMAVNPAKNFYARLGFFVAEATPEFFFMEKTP